MTIKIINNCIFLFMILFCGFFVVVVVIIIIIIIVVVVVVVVVVCLFVTVLMFEVPQSGTYTSVMFSVRKRFTHRNNTKFKSLHPLGQLLALEIHWTHASGRTHTQTHTLDTRARTHTHTLK